ncbi:Spo0B domain-containing protein [Marininema halotolerans]|uniref:Sensor_kinase_SpoOB-type, alpha-helical domain n=1 Tax=Marininema halotolerans TaxID=1155944 RepID=A0A1I6U4C2_9BACL|nr:Spo0B domain-containing protein [Marininema halotolerans]SFS96228.1 Sensor_kinase_SpoOB-type, alpha-helical domain [Marininema halotolerans]
MGSKQVSWAPGMGWIACSILMMAIQPWGWFVGVPLGIITFSLCVRALRQLQRTNEGKARVESAEHSLHLLSRYRHDWLNHVQVIMGYLSVKREERILPLLRELTDAARQEREVAAVGYPPLALWLSTVNQRVPEWIWIIEVNDELKSIHPQWGDSLQRGLEQMAEWLQKQGRGFNEPEEVWVRFEKEGSAWAIHIQPDFPPEMNVPSSEWSALRNTIQKQGGTLDKPSEDAPFIMRLIA